MKYKSANEVVIEKTVLLYRMKYKSANEVVIEKTVLLYRMKYKSANEVVIEKTLLLRKFNQSYLSTLLNFYNLQDVVLYIPQYVYLY
jgi:hypothetical protein